MQFLMQRHKYLYVFMMVQHNRSSVKVALKGENGFKVFV
jgi:hypothetical protein